MTSNHLARKIILNLEDTTARIPGRELGVEMLQVNKSTERLSSGTVVWLMAASMGDFFPVDIGFENDAGEIVEVDLLSLKVAVKEFEPDLMYEVNPPTQTGQEWGEDWVPVFREGQPFYRTFVYCDPDSLGQVIEAYEGLDDTTVDLLLEIEATFPFGRQFTAGSGTASASVGGDGDVDFRVPIQIAQEAGSTTYDVSVTAVKSGKTIAIETGQIALTTNGSQFTTAAFARTESQTLYPAHHELERTVVTNFSTVQFEDTGAGLELVGSMLTKAFTNPALDLSQTVYVADNVDMASGYINSSGQKGGSPSGSVFFGNADGLGGGEMNFATAPIAELITNPGTGTFDAGDYLVMSGTSDKGSEIAIVFPQATLATYVWKSGEIPIVATNFPASEDVSISVELTPQATGGESPRNFRLSSQTVVMQLRRDFIPDVETEPVTST